MPRARKFAEAVAVPSPLQSTSVTRLGPSQPTSVDFSRPPQTSVGFGLRPKPKPRGLGLRRREDGVPCSCRTRCCCYRLLPLTCYRLLPLTRLLPPAPPLPPPQLHYTTLRCTTIAPALPALPFSSQVEISPFTARAGSAIAPITSPAAASGGGPYLATARSRDICRSECIPMMTQRGITTRTQGQLGHREKRESIGSSGIGGQASFIAGAVAGGTRQIMRKATNTRSRSGMRLSTPTRSRAFAGTEKMKTSLYSCKGHGTRRRQRCLPSSRLQPPKPPHPPRHQTSGPQSHQASGPQGHQAMAHRPQGHHQWQRCRIRRTSHNCASCRSSWRTCSWKCEGSMRSSVTHATSFNKF